MIIYDSENGKLYVPGKTDQVYIVTPEDIYNQGFEAGYKDGYREGYEECVGGNVAL